MSPEIKTLDDLVARDVDHDCGGIGRERVCVKVAAVAELMEEEIGAAARRRRHRGDA